MTSARIQHIDVWRCIAITMVVVDHLVAWSHPWYRDMAPGIVWRLESLGKVGVQVFFCISGFVICRGLVAEMRTHGSINMPGFYLRRTFRILPPLYFFILCVGLMNMAGVFDLASAQFLQASTFFCNVEALGKCHWALGHTWSLAYEEQFYLVFPALFVWLAFFSKRARLLWLIAAVAAILTFAYHFDYPFARVYAGHVLCILAGCACALYWDKVEHRLARLPLSVWVLAVLLIPGLRFIGLPPLINDLVYPLVFPMIVCVAVFGTPTSRPMVHAVFANPVLSHLGTISYGIYLWQQLATWDYGFASPVPAVLLMIAVIVGAHYSFKYVELPLMRYGASLAKRKPPMVRSLP